jgi:formiminotetrahydrofolate cyclodeaminase
MPYTDKTLQQFLDELASSDPVPGGGAVAALAGSLAAALVAMVCQLTIGRKNYAPVEDEMRAILPHAQERRARLTTLIDADVNAYARVMDAYKLPKTTEAEKTARVEAIQAALKDAARVPLEVATACAEVFGMARVVAEKGNKSAASDGKVGMLLAQTGLHAAAYNVEINLQSITDPQFVAETQAALKQLTEGRVE